MAARRRLTPSFRDCHPASSNASKAARGASKQRGTQPELTLRRALWAAGLRYEKNPTDLAGKPDLVFRGRKVAVFCDGDFWHGRNWDRRKAKLSVGNNAAYWVAKIERNMQRDLQHTARLVDMGWRVIRIWEGDIELDLAACVARVRGAVEVEQTWAALDHDGDLGRALDLESDDEREE
jgi:DNA mismatch endonuclease (patch repair protein)